MKEITHNKATRAQVGNTLKVAASTMLEPFHSAYVWVGSRNNGAWGKHIREVETLKDKNFPKFFKHHHAEVVEFGGIAKTPELFDEIENCLRDRKGNPQNFIGDKLYTQWNILKTTVAEGIGDEFPGTQMIDYLVSNGDSHSIFFVKEDELKEVRVDAKTADFSIDNITSQLLDERASVTIPATSSSQLLNVELAIEELIESQRTDEGLPTIRRISSITNDFKYRRHAKLEREGVFFTGIRHMGAHSIGELQSEGRILFDKGWMINQEGGIELDQELLETWVKIRSLPYERFGNVPTDAQKNLIREEAMNYAQEQAYFEMIMDKLNGSELVKSFAQSEIYQKYAIEFRDRHAASYGAAEMKLAQSMLASMYLYKFEGVESPNESPSQYYMASVAGYHEGIANFINNYKGAKPELAPGRRVQDRGRVFKDLYSTFEPKRLSEIALDQMRYEQDEKNNALNEATTCMVHAKGEMFRNPVHRSVVEMFHKWGLIVADGRNNRVGMGDTFIGNLMLRTVDVYGNKKFTFPWLRRASGYLGKDETKELPPVSEATETNIEDVIRDVFSGAIGEDGHPYLTQEARIFKHSGTILKYLQENSNVPISVRKFIASLNSYDSIIRVLETMGGISDNDPNIINRFFPDGVGEFHLASVHRYVFDFIRGVESNLVLGEGNKKKGIFKLVAKAQIWAGNWRNRDFSKLDSSTIDHSITETLKDGHSRLVELNHAVGDISKMAKALGLDNNEMSQLSREEYGATWKTFQEKLEVVFGWDTTAMKYLRWQELWNVWNTLGAAWDCICFTRKTIFNPRILKATY